MATRNYTPPIRDAKTERNCAIVKAWRAGEGERELGVLHGISPRRVADIVAQAAMADWRLSRRYHKRQKVWKRDFARDYEVKQRRYQREIAKWFADHPDVAYLMMR